MDTPLGSPRTDVTRALGGATPEVSVIIPLGSRYDDLEQLCRDLQRILAPRAKGYEVIFVDDATGPNTRLWLRALMTQYPEVRVIRLQRFMGESTALAIGAQSARGAVLITLDPYLHVSLEELPKLLAPLRQGMDLVCGWRHPRQESGLSRAASAGFNTLARWLTGVTVHDLNCRMRAMDRRVLEGMPIYGELHRFLPIFAARRGYRWCEVQVPQRPGKRELGATDPRAYFRHFLDLLTLVFLTRFIKRPLHFFGVMGVTSFAVGCLIALDLVYIKLVRGSGIGHRPLLLLAVMLVVVGIQIASIGLLGELMIFTHARQLKDYVVQEEQG